MTLHIHAADLPIHPIHVFMDGRLTIQPFAVRFPCRLYCGDSCRNL